MFEQDYIMRLVKEIVRVLLKLLFNLDTESPAPELLESEEERAALDALFDMVDSGNINEAENQAYEIFSDGSMNHFEMALLFYSYLNDKSDDFLTEHDFSREEIRQGLRDAIAGYGLAEMADVLMAEEFT